jgi:hypothetical protein
VCGLSCVATRISRLVFVLFPVILMVLLPFVLHGSAVTLLSITGEPLFLSAR